MKRLISRWLKVTCTTVGKLFNQPASVDTQGTAHWSEPASVMMGRVLNIPRRHSIRGSLLITLLVFLLVTMVLTALVTYRTTKHEMQEILDGQLVTTAKALFSLIAMEVSEGHHDDVGKLLGIYDNLQTSYSEWRENADVEVYDTEFYFQLMSSDSEAGFYSSGDVEPIVSRSETRNGFFLVNSNGKWWHVFGLHDPQTTYRFFMAQSQEVRTELSRDASVNVIIPELLGIPVVLFACLLVINYSLRPLTRLERELNNRSPDDLKPLSDEGEATQELATLIQALNGLFLRVKNLLGRERRFSSNASHELRTPLAGILANVDAARSMQNSEEVHARLDNIAESATNASAIVSSLLLLSRLESSDALDQFDKDCFDLKAVVLDEISELYARYPNRDLVVSVQEVPSATLQGSRVLFSLLIKNLLDNSVLYGVKPCKIVMHAEVADSYKLSISDNGPGIAIDQMDKVFERFRRAGKQDIAGVGLGLSIVARIADLFSSSVTLENNVEDGGLTATVTVNQFEL